MKKKIFSILFALVLVVSFSLVTAVPTASAEEELNVYGYGSHLYVADGTTDWAEISIPVDIALKDISELKFREWIESYTPNGWSVSVLLGIDADDDSVFEADVAGWHVGPDAWTLAALNGDTFVEMDGASGNPAKGIWTETDALSVAQWWTPDSSGAGFAKSDAYPWTFYGAFADFVGLFLKDTNQTSLIPNDDARVLCVKLLIGGSGNWMDETAYVDEVTINGETYYLTIQRAVDSATGTIINVAAGIYTEDVNINKSLQLLGAKVLVPAGPDASPAGRSNPLEESIIDGRIVIIGGTGSTIDGFTILSGGQHGIELNGGDVIKNNIIDGGPGNEASGGIWSGGSGGHFIANNNIRNYERGMLFDGNVVPQFTVTENYITGSSSTGIILMGSLCNGHIITNNLIEENSSGMVLAQGEHQVSGNRILNNDGSGIYICGTARTYGIQIIHNTIEGNGWSIYLDCDHAGAINNVAHFNDIVDNANGLYNGHSAVFDAEKNWWGNASGPIHASNTGGTGDPVTDKVNFSPWLGDPVGTEPMTIVNLVTGYNTPPVPINGIATVFITGGNVSQGTIGGTSGHPDVPSISLFGGTGKTSVLSLDIYVTGYTSGMALITVPYPDEEVTEPVGGDGIVDGTTVVETTLGLYYWDDAASMWHIAGNNTVDPDANTVSGVIPVSALTGTPLGGGGYPADEATVEIGNVSVGYSGNDTVALTITTNTARLGAATIDVTFDPIVVELLGGENSDFDSLTVNPFYEPGKARFVANQLGLAPVDATGGAVLAQVRLKAVGTTGSSSPLTLTVITLKDNDGIAIPIGAVINGTASIGGLGDANSDGRVDVYDCVYIARAIAGFHNINLGAMDVDGSGTVDAFDCTYLARHIAGIPGHPLGG